MIKDNGERIQLPGMVRSTTDDKVDYTLALDGPLFERLAAHLTEGAKHYSKRNWMGAISEVEYLRFRESFLRHTIQYLRGDTDEDHFAAAVFNLNGMEYVRLRLAKRAEVKIVTFGGGGPGEVTHFGPERRTGPKDRRVCHDETRARLEHYRRVSTGRRKDEIDYSHLPVCK